MKCFERSSYTIEKLGEELKLDRELCYALQQIFFKSVHAISDQYYTAEQKSAWAPAHLSVCDWMRRLEESTSWIALDRSTLKPKGFIELDVESNIDLIYVHPETQKSGIASKLVGVAEQWVRTEAASKQNWYTHASDAAHDFFTRSGFVPVRRNQITRRNVLIENTTMVKKL